MNLLTIHIFLRVCLAFLALAVKERTRVIKKYFEAKEEKITIDSGAETNIVLFGTQK